MPFGKHVPAGRGPKNYAGLGTNGSGGFASEVLDMQKRYRPEVVIADDMLAIGGDLPSEAKNRFELKQKMMSDPAAYGLDVDPTQGHLANWTMGEDDITLARQREQALEKAGFLEYVNSMVNVKEPGMLAWLNDIVPEFAEAQIEQLDVSLDLMKHAKTISAFGIQKRDDLFFQYLVDSGRLRDAREYVKGAYIPGFLNPGRVMDMAEPKTKGSFFSNLINPDNPKPNLPAPANAPDAFGQYFGPKSSIGVNSNRSAKASFFGSLFA